MTGAGDSVCGGLLRRAGRRLEHYMNQAVMTRLWSDQPGPGQEMARRGIQIARAGIVDRRTQVQILWVPGHAGVPVNELADGWAVDAARGERKREGRGRHGKRMEKSSLSFLKAERKKKAVREWRDGVIRRAGAVGPSGFQQTVRPRGYRRSLGGRLRR